MYDFYPTLPPLVDLCPAEEEHPVGEERMSQTERDVSFQLGNKMLVGAGVEQQS